MPDLDTRRENYPTLKLSSQANASQEFQEVLLLRLPYFYGYAFRVLGNAAEAEDAVQDALMAAHKNVNQFRGQAQMSTWLMTIVRNCALMQLRRRSRHNLLSLDQRVDEKQPYFVGESLSDGRPSPEDEFRHTELAARLRRCTRLLSPTLRRTFQLRVMDGLSTTEIAEHLGVPLGTVKAQLARARAKIARHIKPGLAPRFRPRQHQPTEAQ